MVNPPFIAMRCSDDLCNYFVFATVTATLVATMTPCRLFAFRNRLMYYVRATTTQATEAAPSQVAPSHKSHRRLVDDVINQDGSHEWLVQIPAPCVTIMILAVCRSSLALCVTPASQLTAFPSPHLRGCRGYFLRHCLSSALVACHTQYQSSPPQTVNRQDLPARRRYPNTIDFCEFLDRQTERSRRRPPLAAVCGPILARWASDAIRYVSLAGLLACCINSSYVSPCPSVNPSSV